MRILTASLAALSILVGQFASAQSWTSGSSRTATWSTPNVVGDGVDRFAEVSTTTQGGDPPALAYEPAAIDEGTNYTRSQWLGSPSLPGDRFDNGEAKFRITCNFSHFGQFDPILYFGQEAAGHHHTFIGNKGTNGSSNYTTLRNNPASSCSGGPLNGTAYWEPTLMYELSAEITVPVKPNVVTFYYVLHYDDVDSMYRLPRGLAFIGGVDPSDRLNTARLAEIPNGQGWDKSRRYNGWAGWACFNGGTVIPIAAGNTADANPQAANYVRQLVNEDGSDPWGGACEDPSYILIANNTAPRCWDGHNLTSPNGRDHFRYAIRKGDNTFNGICPQGWWQVPTFEVKSEFANGHGGVSGHAWRSKLYLSSDRMDPNPDNWHPRGSTFHFDWMNGWDSVVQRTWMDKCTGTDQNGDAGEPLTCNDSTISDTQKMLVTSASPDPTMSNDPVITFHTYHDDPAKEAFGPIEDGTVLDLTVEHNH